MASAAARVGSINVLLSTQLGGAVTGLNAFAGHVERTGIRTQRTVSGIDRSVGSLNRTMSSLNSRGLTGITVGALRSKNAVDQLRGLALAAGVAVGGLVPASVLASMIRVTDRAHRLSNQLRTVTEDTADLKSTQEALFQVAQRTRSGFDGTVTLYARTARATEHLGLSQQKLLRITETVQKAFAVGGASSAEAQGAAIQLSQGIASDRFSGEEFRSVAENAPVLLRGMAESLGVNIGKLREMAHAGELTAKVVTKAILDASRRIDADFAKTSSTIEQAWVRLGNAATKYAMDSEKASAGSSAIVTVLNGIANNIDTTADALVLLGAAAMSVFAGRPLNALRQNLSAQGALLTASRAASATAVQQAQIEAAANAQRLASAKAHYAMVTQGVATEATRVRASRELHAANIANLASQKALTAATQAHVASLNAASASGRVFAAAGRAASAAWAFAGGPFGAALLALSVVLYQNASRAAQAQERAERYAEAIKRAGDESGAAAISIKEAGKSLEYVTSAATEAERIVRFRQATSDAANYMGQLGIAATALGLRLGRGSAVYRSIEELRKQFEDGEISAEDLRKRIDDIARANPDVSGLLLMFQQIAERAAAAAGAVEGLKQAVGGISPSDYVPGMDLPTAAKGGRVAEPSLDQRMDRAAFDAARDRALAARMGWDEYFKFPKDKKAKAPPKTVDDRFSENMQAVRDRIAALQEEQAALGLSYREQERRKMALDLEHEALKQVREEARKKGRQDWQNAQLSPDQVAQINEVSAAYAQQADQLRRLTEIRDFSKDFLGGFITDMLDGIQEGKSAWEAFQNAGVNALEKIRNKLIDIAVDQAINALISGLTGALTGRGGGGIGGLLGSLLGGGFKPTGNSIISAMQLHSGGQAGSHGTSRLIAANTNGLPRYHTGRAGLGYDELMAVLEDTESVLTANDVGRTAGALSSAADEIKGGAAGGLHITVGVSTDANGNLRPFVESVTKQGIENYDRQMPARVAEIQASPRRR